MHFNFVVTESWKPGMTEGHGKSNIALVFKAGLLKNE